MDTASFITFYKFQGAGNDFIIIDGRYGLEKTLMNGYYESKCRFLCDRHRGIGCDQLLLLRDSEACDFEVLIYNQDGSIAEMCGNGVRCCALFAFQYAVEPIRSQKMRIQTMKRDVDVDINEQGFITIDMGVPIVENTSSISLGSSIGTFLMYNINMGNPHCVILCKAPWDVSSLEITHHGPSVEKSVENGTNVEFVFLQSSGSYKTRVWERGVGETLSCGSGACATAVALILHEGGSSKDISMPGGTISIEWNDNKDESGKYISPLKMKGPASFVFKGYVPL